MNWKIISSEYLYKETWFTIRKDVCETPEVNLALHGALEKAAEDDLILVCGSVFVVGEVIPF